MDILLSSLIQGGIYAIASLGLALAWAMAKMLNFGHGSFLMLGAYLTFFGINALGWSLPASILLSLIIVSVLLAVTYRFMLYRLRDNIAIVLLITFALAFVLEEAIRIIFGAEYMSIPSVVRGAVDFLGVSISLQKLLILGVSIFAIFLLWMFISRTRWGQAMRATGESEEGALVCGINLRTTGTMAMALAGTLTAIGGILIGSTYYLFPAMGMEYLSVAFSTMVLAGLGSIWGIVLAAVLLASAEMVGAAFFGSGWFRMILFGAVILFVLILKPTGLFGKK